MKPYWRFGGLCVLMAGCEPGGDVAIEVAPRAPASDRSIAGDASPATDAGEALTLVEPPGLVEGAQAEALRAAATGAVVVFDEETNIFTFVPLDAAGGEAAVRLSPSTLAGWGSGPARSALDAFSPGTGAAYLLRGTQARELVAALPLVQKAAAPGWPAGAETGAQALAAPVPANGLYRVALDGRDADAPRPLATGLHLAGRTARSEATGQYFLTLDTGLAVLPDVDVDDAAPRLFRPHRPGRQYEVLGLSEAAGRLLFTEVDWSSGMPRVERLWSVPVADVGAEPKSEYRYPRPPEPGTFVVTPSATQLDDRWFLANGGDGTAVVIDATGEVASLALGGAGPIAGKPRLAGNTLVFARYVLVEDRIAGVELSAQRLGAEPPRPRIVLNLGEDLLATAGAADAQGEHLAFGTPEGAFVIRLDGGAPSLLRTSPNRAGTGPVGFSPDGRTVLIVTSGTDGLGVEALPRSGAAGRVLMAPDPTIDEIDLGGVEERGHFVVLRETEGEATLTRGGLDGAADPPIALPGHSPSLRRVPGGLIVTTRGGARHIDAVTPAGPEPRFASLRDFQLWGIVPGGAFALAAERPQRVEFGPTHAVDLRRAGPPRALTPGEGDWRLDALRSGGAIMSRRVGPADEAFFVPFAEGFDAARAYAMTGGYLAEDLPTFGGAAFIVHDAEADRQSVVFAPDGGEAPHVVATLDSRSRVLTTLQAVTETRTVVGTVKVYDDLGDHTDEFVQWPLDPTDAPDAEPVVVALPGLKARTIDALPAPGTYLVSGSVAGQAGLWRLDFGAAPADRLVPLAPAGLGLPSPSLAAALSDQAGILDGGGAGDFLSTDRTVVLAAGPGERVDYVTQRPLYVVHLDGRDRDGVEPLLGGLAVLDGTARMLPDGRHVLFSSPEGMAWVATARPGATAHLLGSPGSALLLGMEGVSWRALAVARGGGDSLVFLDQAKGELAVVDPDDGQRDVRATLTSPLGTGRPQLLRLTPDERAALIGWSGPTGRRLYVVSLEGEPAIARLVADDDPADEALLALLP